MDSLRTYLNKLPKDQQQDFALRCGTTVGYLRKALSTNQRIGVELSIHLARESGGEVSFDALRPDVDWQYVRGSEPSSCIQAAPTQSA